ncbi:Uncharacterized protein pbN1_15110 [Aromatoleum bremense]|nr:Uncharacterized protein pbN1_15110 [Aromatoleum bremense]
MSGVVRQILRTPVLALGSAVVWGVLEFLALQRARLAAAPRRRPGSRNDRSTRD